MLFIQIPLVKIVGLAWFDFQPNGRNHNGLVKRVQVKELSELS